MLWVIKTRMGRGFRWWDLGTDGFQCVLPLYYFISISWDGTVRVTNQVSSCPLTFCPSRKLQHNAERSAPTCRWHWLPSRKPPASPDTDSVGWQQHSAEKSWRKHISGKCPNMGLLYVNSGHWDVTQSSAGLRQGTTNYPIQITDMCSLCTPWL